MGETEVQGQHGNKISLFRGGITMDFSLIGDSSCGGCYYLYGDAMHSCQKEKNWWIKSRGH